MNISSASQLYRGNNFLSRHIAPIPGEQIWKAVER